MAATTKAVTLKGSRKTSKGFFETEGPKMDLTLTYLDPASLDEGFQESRNQIAHKREENNQRRIKHEQRRRKYVRLLDASQVTHSRSFFEEEVVGRVLTKANCENEEIGLKKEVMAFKDIIALNRRNRNKRMEELVANQSMHDLAWENVEAKREVQWTTFLDTNSQFRRREVTNNALKYAGQKDVSVTIKEFIGKLCDAVDWVLTYREMTGIADHRSTSDAYSTASPTSTVIPDLLWQDIKHAVVYDGPFPKALPHVVPVLPSTLLVPFNVSDRPLFANTPWLTDQVFSAAYVLDTTHGNATGATDAGEAMGAIAEGSEHDTDPTSRPLTANPSRADASAAATVTATTMVPKPTTCSSYLAADEWQALVARNIDECTANATASSGDAHDGATSSAPAESPEAASSHLPSDRDAHVTPAWLHRTDPSHYLSEAIIAVRSAEKPLPPEPEPVIDTRHISMRVALFGASLALRHRMKDALVRLIPRLTVISVEVILASIVAHEYATSSDGDYVALCDNVLQLLQAGEPITDPLYVRLIMHAIAQIPTVNNGFVLVDFPSTSEQCLLLMQAFSGIRYDQPRPQPSDYLSPYAAHETAVHWDYSIERAGIDVLLCTDYPQRCLSDHHNGADAVTCPTGASAASTQAFEEQQLVERLIKDRTTARRALYTQETVYIGDQTASVRALQQIHDPQHPRATVGVDVTFARREVQHIAALATYLHALEDVAPTAAATGDGDGDGADAAEAPTTSAWEIDELIERKAEALRARFIPEERWGEDFWQVHDVEEAIARYVDASVLPPVVEDALQVAADEIVERVVTMACDEAEAAAVAAAKAAAEAAAAEAAAAAAAAEAAAAQAAAKGKGAKAAAPAAAAAPAPAAAAAASEHAEGDAADASASSPSSRAATPGYPFPPRTVTHAASTLLLPRHAAALNALWTQAETASTLNGRDFCAALRDIRFQALQRNRCLLDLVAALLLRDDGRQTFLDAFVQRFNDDMPDELRFDPDCVAELTLRTLLLRDFFCQLSEQKLAEATAMVAKYAADGCLAVWQYRVQCEAALLLQAELQRFYVALDVVFDTAKALQGFPAHVRVRNDLEPVLPTVIEAEGSGGGSAGAGKDGKKGGAAKAPPAKDAAKKSGKDAAGGGAPGGVLGAMSNFTAYREAIAPLLTQATVWTSKIPQPVDKADEAEAAAAAAGGKGKAKPPAKPKKGEDPNAGVCEPFHEMWKAVQDDVAKWQRGQFTVHRDLFYGTDDALCAAVERAVWYEAEKFLHAGRHLEQSVSRHVTWLQENDADLFALLGRLTQDRFSRELRATQGLVDVIQAAIAEATALGDLWLVTSDACPTVQSDTVWRTLAPTLLPPTLREDYETPAGVSHYQRQRQASLQKLRSSSMRLSFVGNGNGGVGGGSVGLGGRKASRSASLRGSLSGGFNNPRGSSDPFVAGLAGGGGEYRAGEEEALFVALHVQRASTLTAGVPTTAAVLQHRYEERYARDREALLATQATARQQREEEYLDMGLTPAAAKLAAFNELLLEEQHQQADLLAKYAVYFQANATGAEGGETGAPQVELRPQSRHAIVAATATDGDDDAAAEAAGVDDDDAMAMTPPPGAALEAEDDGLY